MGTLLPIGIQSFEKLVTSGYKYIDKTAAVHRLVTTCNCCFLSRPRRFGKSLLLSTLEAYFEGNSNLFDGLAIKALEKEWTAYPVLHLDLNAQNYSDEGALERLLSLFLSDTEKRFNISSESTDLALRFASAIAQIHEKTGKKVVILIDEYDKPLISTISQPALQDKFRTTLKSFFSVLKSCDAHTRFSILTGVTKFSKVSIFSDLNNLDDISRVAEFYDICGITETELRTSLHEEVLALAQKISLSTDQAFQKLKAQYDGYRFTDETNVDNRPIDGIYNPFSLLSALKYKKLDSYWFETGTPTFLIDKLSTLRFEPMDIDGAVASSAVMSNATSDDLSPLLYLFQTGYLTIKHYDSRFKRYTLGYPNNEVKEGFVNCLARHLIKPDAAKEAFDISNFVTSLEEGDTDGFMKNLQGFMSSIPYELIPEKERHVQNVIYLLTTLCGFYTDVESHTSKGRIDITVRVPKFIYILELKYDVTALCALEQIKEKGYADKFATDTRDVICVGVNYSSELRNFDEWVAERIGKRI